jgi:hypothetical protein
VLKVQSVVTSSACLSSLTSFQGTSIVEWLLRDIGERRIISKQDVTAIAQSLLDRQVIVKVENSDSRFSESDSYAFHEVCNLFQTAIAPLNSKNLFNLPFRTESKR